ncbi:hypothetical protein BH11MYX1_BH11MYX1_51410 [soil metagenome]
MPSRIYPSCDLHLFPGATPTPLRLFTMMTVWTDFLKFEGSSLTLTAVRPSPPAPAIATLVNNAIVPGVEGELLARLTATLTIDNTSDSWDVAMRITVHHRLHALFVPRSHLALETGRSDRVLTVYGQFASATSALSTFDITRHIYLHYQVATLTGAADAVTVDPTGRVTTGANPGTARIIITVPGVAGVSTSIDIEVTAAVTDRPILVPRWTGSAIRKKSIVLVSEGFTDAEQGRFDDLAFKIAEGLVLKTSPYSVVRESLDVYSAFVPSPESGLTIGPPVVPIASSVYSLVTPNLEPFTTGVPGDFTLTQLITLLGDPQASTLTFAQANSTLNHDQRQLSQIMFDLWRALGPPPPPFECTRPTSA